MLDRLVLVVQVAALALVVVAVVMLFANDPTPPPAAAADLDVPAEFDAAGLYGSNCAGCHGGDGSGGIGPPLKSARILDRFPDASAQVAVVTNGQGAMPAFGARLTAEEIEVIVAYTRTSL